VKNNFTLLPNTKGQVWNLSEVNGKLMMGHTDGSYMISGQTATVLDGTSGFWTFLPISNISPSPVMLAGTYNGVNFYNYDNGKFTNPSIHSHFESARYIALDNNIAWVAHPYKGLYRVELNGGVNPRYTIYKDKKGILSKNRNHIFKIKSRVVLSTDNGIYEYNSRTDEFEPCELLEKVFGAGRVTYMKEDEEGNIWFIENKVPGVVEFVNDRAEITFIPELKNKVMESGFEYVYPYNSKNIFIAGQQGFYHLNYEQYKTLKVKTPIIISAVKAINKGDSTIFSGYYVTEQDKQMPVNKEVPTLGFAWNSLHFDYSSPLYGREAGIEYSYYLEDFDKSWSSWSKKTEKDYTYLSPGTYTFKVKARRNEGDESAIATYRFVILPPWYRTNWAYALYFLAFCAIAFGGYKWLKRKFMLQQLRHEEEQHRLQYLNQLQQEKHEEEQKQLQYLHQLELERNANEIIKLKNEKLEADIQLKNTELASTTMSLVQKGEMLNKVKEEFLRMKNGNGNENDKNGDEYKKIIKMLGDDKVKKNWDQFAVHFDKVHADFLVSLKNHYPNLTPSELKLCAYLRLNLSSKEISQVMNITIKSVELSRYRLRKKLQLPSDANLYYFLLNFHSEIHKEAGKV
jgi:DNA-binding CsgD family transcriptional regulator